MGDAEDGGVGRKRERRLWTRGRRGTNRKKRRRRRRERKTRRKRIKRMGEEEEEGDDVEEEDQEEQEEEEEGEAYWDGRMTMNMYTGDDEVDGGRKSGMTNRIKRNLTTEGQGGNQKDAEGEKEEGEVREG